MTSRIALVTGSTGIAAATARRLGRAGWSIAVVGVDEDSVTTLCDELLASGAVAAGFAADLRSDADATAAVTACTEALGAPTALVATAGGSGRRFGDGPITEMSASAWDETLRLNTTTAATIMAAVVPGMLAASTGSIVVVSSVLASAPAPPRFETHAYAAAKGALNALVTSTAASYAHRGVRVNAVLPAATATPMAARAAADPEILGYLERKQPLSNGMLDPDDVAAAVAFLVSDDASSITGQTLAVDGGWSVVQAT